MLRDDLWRRLVRRTWRGGMLCLDCVERRLGRALHVGDFAKVPVNQQQAHKCPALAQRLATPSPHPAFAHDWRARRSQVISTSGFKVAKKLASPVKGALFLVRRGLTIGVLSRCKRKSALQHRYQSSLSGRRCSSARSILGRSNRRRSIS